MNPAGERLGLLPRIPRPTGGQSVEDYVRRLAEANHLKPSYLHGYLTGGPSYYPGRIRPERLAAATGRTLIAITHAFPALATPAPRPTRRVAAANAAKARARAERERQFAAIRYDALAGASIRSLAAKHHVGRRIVKQALASPAPPPRKKPKQRPTPALDQVRAHLDRLLDEDLNIRQIWERVLDATETYVSYRTVADYVRTRRPSSRRASTPPAPEMALPMTGTPVTPAPRELFALVRKRPGMYGITNFATACTFITGYDAAHNWSALNGFREMLIPRLDRGDNLTWVALVRHLAPGGWSDPLTPEADAAATETLFELLDEFLARSTQHGGLLRIYEDYLTWLKAQDWYDALKHLKIPPTPDAQPIADDTID